jgi:hypothetical protein
MGERSIFGNFRPYRFIGGPGAQEFLDEHESISADEDLHPGFAQMAGLNITVRKDPLLRSNG